jgi:23S rRNA (guanosine2251-2'-O)-methyltransferase
MLEILYGRNAVLEALRANRRRCVSITIAEGVQEKGSAEQILATAAEKSLPIKRVPRNQLDTLGAVNHQGIAAQFESYPYADLPDILGLSQTTGEPPFLLLLDSLQDPQNLGTLLRTAEVVGVHGVVIPRHRAAEITPAVCNASAGAVEHLRIAQVTNLVRTMEELKEAGVWIVGVENLPEAEDYHAAKLNMPLALVIGSEGHGLGHLVRQRCDLWIRLPMKGRIQSLNAAVAGSIVLYEAWRQRQGGARS